MELLLLDWSSCAADFLYSSFCSFSSSALANSSSEAAAVNVFVLSNSERFSLMTAFLELLAVI